MDICEQKFTKLQYAILRLLMLHQGRALNLRAIAKHLKVSSTAVGKALPLLIKEELIDAEKDKETKRYTVELKETRKTTNLKITENLKMLHESGLSSYLDDQLPGATIIVFGSYRRGEDTEDSDIDIAVIERGPKPLQTERYALALKRKISVQFYENLKSIHKHLRENILNGIVLSGGIRL